MSTCQKSIALVTAASRGIGLACVRRLAKDGHRVYLGVRRMEEGERLAAGIRQDGGEAEAIYFDASKEETYGLMVEGIEKREGRLDILVNNFGTTDVKADFDLLNGDTDRFFEIVNTNLKSVYLPCKYAVGAMVKNGGGSIVNISSVGGRYPDMSRLAYGVSKASINFLTQNIAVQYAKDGVRCNAVLPGFIQTDASMDNMPKAFLDAFLSNVPLGRAGKPEDIANLVAFLAGPQSTYVTGEVIAAAGGFGLPSPMYAMYGRMGKQD